MSGPDDPPPEDRFEFELELDVPAQPPLRGAARPGAAPPARPLPALDDELELGELHAPPSAREASLAHGSSASQPPEPEPFSLELEDIARPAPAATPHSLQVNRPQAPTLPQPAPPTTTPAPPIVQTLELRVAASVDRMSAPARISILVLTIVGMVVFGVTVLSISVRSALRAMEEQREAAEAEAAAGVYEEDDDGYLDEEEGYGDDAPSRADDWD
ncbi:MAG: hypothetical protein R3B40_24425 [Polyangiales bacterium]|nr:hypothetical protein [Myxococcales bacterium]MCB9659529.1 hypothetical protein [Sandaracinaceae bacterium]